MTITSDPELLAVFRQEVAESLDDLAGLVDAMRTAEGGELEAAVATAFRIMHNVKGASRAAGFAPIERLAHALENVLEVHRSQGARPAPALLARLADAVVVIERLVEGEDVVAVADRLTEAIGGPPPASAWPDEVSPAPRDDVLVADEGEREAAIDRRDRQGVTVRVDVARLDELMTHIGGLLGAQARIAQLAAEMGVVVDLLHEAQRHLPPSHRVTLREPLRRAEQLADREQREAVGFGHLTTSVGESMMRLRMLPLAREATQWRRVVRTAAHELGRRVSIAIDVGEIEVDKHVLDVLRDPMMHLLRNAVDHGIEPPADRVRAGKPDEGQIRIDAKLAGAHVQIDITDDGRGPDPAAIGAKAVARGLVAAEVLERMSTDELLQLVFAPGLSTAEAVTHLSGRGIGLDVVRRRVEELAGTVRISGVRGRGTTVRLSVPSSLVSTRGLIAEVAGAAVALPIEYVQRSVRVDASQLEVSDGGSVVQLDGVPLRVRPLASVLGGVRPVQPGWLTVVVVVAGDARLGLVVDVLLGEEEFVTKPLPWNLAGLAGVNGAVTRSDGSLAIVVDVPALIGVGMSERLSGLVVHAPSRKVPRILVIDDSLTSRTLERNILMSAGYAVETAVDGEDGWRALCEGDFDLVVSDIEMPRLSGFDLVRRIRAHGQHGKTPIILVTSLERPQDIAEGAAAGADEYIVKGSFDQRKLLEAVARLL